MTGIFLLLVIGAWLGVAIVLTKVLTRRLRPGAMRGSAGAVLFVGLLVLPVLDEVIGGFQFRALCAKSPSFRVGVDKPEGRSTRVSFQPANELVAGTTIPIYHSRIDYTDVKTGELVVSFDEYVAKGGLLIRALGISESNAPLTLGRPACSPQTVRGESVKRTLKFSVIN